MYLYKDGPAEYNHLADLCMVLQTTTFLIVKCYLTYDIMYVYALNLQHPVCSSSCEYSVKCLETSVPWDHLAVSYTHACVLTASFETAHALTMHACI